MTILSEPHRHIPTLTGKETLSEHPDDQPSEPRTEAVPQQTLEGSDPLIRTESQTQTEPNDCLDDILPFDPSDPTRPDELMICERKVSEVEVNESAVRYECSTQPSILLLGIAGQGKSTLGNSLAKKEMFEEGFGIDPVTKCVHTCEFDYLIKYGKTKTRELLIQGSMKVTDTPGTEEPNALDELANVRKIYKYWRSLLVLTMILIPLQAGRRADSQFVKSFQYYKKMLQHFFEGGNWGIVLTNVPPKVNEESYLRETKASLEKWLGFKVPHIFCFWKKQARQELHEEARQKILKTIFMKKDRVVPGMSFSLPPVLEEKRHFLQVTAETILAQTRLGITQASHEVNEKAQRLRATQDLVNQLSKMIDTNLQKKRELENLVKVLPEPIMGGEQTRLNVFTERFLRSPVPYPMIKIEKDLWNCRAHFQFAEDFLEVRISPFFWTWSTHPNGLNWFYQLDVFVDGHVRNAEAIDRILIENQRLEEEKRERSDEVQTLLDEINGIRGGNHQKLVQQFQQVIYVMRKLYKTIFSNEEIDSALLLLERLIQKDCQLAAVDYSEFPDFRSVDYYE